MGRRLRASRRWIARILWICRRARRPSARLPRRLNATRWRCLSGGRLRRAREKRAGRVRHGATRGFRTSARGLACSGTGKGSGFRAWPSTWTRRTGSCTWSTTTVTRCGSRSGLAARRLGSMPSTPVIAKMVVVVATVARTSRSRLSSSSQWQSRRRLPRPSSGSASRWSGWAMPCACALDLTPSSPVRSSHPHRWPPARRRPRPDRAPRMPSRFRHARRSPHGLHARRDRPNRRPGPSRHSRHSWHLRSVRRLWRLLRRRRRSTSGCRR